MFTRSRWLILTLLCFSPVAVAAASIIRSPLVDPFTNPKHDAHNPLRYIASNSLTAVATPVLLLVAVSQSWCLWRWGAKWMLPMIVGAYMFAFGISFRFGLHLHPDSRPLYIVHYLFVVLAPCTFVAGDYILLGRLAKHVGSERYLLVPARWITTLFVSSDIITFLTQATGASLSVSATSKTTIRLGSHIFLTGLATQLASFVVFTFIYMLFLYRVYTSSLDTWTMDKSKAWYNDWRALATMLFVSCVGILIRSVFRVIELSQGYEGHLATTESFFYGLDTLPLCIAIVVFIPFWPGRFIPDSPLASAPKI